MTVEIPFNSSVKYEFDKDLNQMRCDRLLTTSMLYPGNYGYIPETLSGDGDPLDILLVCDYAIYPGTIVNVKVVGVLLTTDEKGEDEKLIAVPSNSVDPSFEIENILFKHSLIDECAVIGIPDKLLGENICAFIKVQSGAKITEKDLKIFCRDKLADFKQPKKIIIINELKDLTEIPKGPTKKILYRKLKDYFKNYY